ncbi:MAG: heterodisulfide reductase [candidate division Zixibacteria bacterium]|nr:heterodisulfide reductase [candidate division Zixibacteria bacterium]
MIRKISPRTINDDFRRKVKEISGQDIQQCFQCGTCSASCPMGRMLDLLPRKLMSLLQFGQSDAIAAANTAWVCASCHTCMVRCPRGIDITKVMEAIRQLTLRQNINRINPSEIPAEEVNDMPQIAMVSGFRKLTS